MRLDVALAPALLAGPERKVCVVIDVLRATSSLATMFARGLGEALVAGTVEQARALRAERPGHLLCGEEQGLAPAGFDYGNSPVEFDGLDLRGQRAIVATTNGTRALSTAAVCRSVYTAALVNASAAARAAAREARDAGLDLVLLCAGNGGGRLFSLEDAYCAGALVDALEQDEHGLELWSSARAALRLYRSYDGPEEALRESDHARSLVAMGLGEDVTFCAQRDLFDVAPRLAREAGGTLRLTVRA